MISALGNRVFMLHNVNQKQPIIFQTRWAMSYLRGPLTRSQVRELVKDQRAALLGQATAPGAAPAAAAPSTPQPAVAPAAPVAAAALGSTAPGLPHDVPQVYLPARRSMYQALGDLEARLGSKLNVTDTKLRYDAHLLGLGTVNFVDDKRNVREQQSVKLLVSPPGGSNLVRWDEGSPIEIDERDLAGQPDGAAVFGEVPASINTARKLTSLRSDLTEYLYRNLTYPLFYSPAVKVYSLPGEDERSFKIRLQQVAREQARRGGGQAGGKISTQAGRLAGKVASRRDRAEEG